MENINKIIEFIKEIENLKSVTRTAWTKTGRRESTAEHSWRLAMLLMVLEEDFKDIDINKRIANDLKQICQREENRVAIVTHGGVIRSVCADILHTGQENKLKFGIDLENTSFTHLIYDEDRDFFILERFNDFAHLESHPELLRKNWKTSLERNG